MRGVLDRMGIKISAASTGNLYEHGQKQRAATGAASAMELIGVAVDETGA